MLGTSVAQMWAGQVAHFIDPNNAKTLSLPGGCSCCTCSCCNQPGYQYLQGHVEGVCFPPFGSPGAAASTQLWCSGPGEFCGPLRPDGGYSKRDTRVSGFVSHSSATSFRRECLFWINATVFVQRWVSRGIDGQQGAWDCWAWFAYAVSLGFPLGRFFSRAVFLGICA